jgi:hypothetical protein
MGASSASAGHAPTFEAHAKEVILRLRTAFGAIMEALPDKVRRPHELQRTLGIDKNLAWKIVRIVEAKDPFRAGQHVPGPAALRIFLNAARTCVDDVLIRAAAEAGEEFEELIEVHAGDRASLGMMMAGHVSRGGAQADLAHRKAAFQGMSYIWGIQAAAQLKAHFLHPSAQEGMLDMASLLGFVSLRRIRPNVSWVMAQVKCTDDDGEVRRSCVREPVDGSRPDVEVPLLAEFCSQPLPRFRRIRSPSGFLEDELVEGPVGKTGAITCFTSEVGRAIATRYRDEHNRWAVLNARLHTPCETLVFDEFVHEDLFGRIAPELAVYSNLGGGPWFPEAGLDRHRLPVSASVEYLGKGPSVVYTSEISRYTEMVCYVFDKLGWDGARFDVYRAVVQYPPIPTCVALMHELPEAPR